MNSAKHITRIERLQRQLTGARATDVTTTDATTTDATIRNVVVVGGTHGNEYTGVFVAKRLEAHPERLLTGLDTLNVSSLIANTAAVAANRRFIDEDLNRQFTLQGLETQSTSRAGKEPLEAKRAREIDEIIGPKLASSRRGAQTQSAADFVFDLHTTTSNLGTTIILHDEDPVCLRLAAFVSNALGGEAAQVRVLLEEICAPAACPYLSSSGTRGIEIEVGPTPQGVLRHDVVDKTEKALRASLEFLHRRNLNDSFDKEIGQEATLVVYRTIGTKLPWPVDAGGFPAAVVHRNLQDNDWRPMSRGDPLFERSDGTTIVYDGAQGDTIVPIFINEGGYYMASSGCGIALAQRVTVPVPPKA